MGTGSYSDWRGVADIIMRCFMRMFRLTSLFTALPLVGTALSAEAAEPSSVLVLPRCPTLVGVYV